VGRDQPTRGPGLRLAAAVSLGLAALLLGACGSGPGSSTDSTATTTHAGGSPGSGAGGHAGGGGGPGAPPAARTSHPKPRHRFEGPPGSPMHRTYPGRILSHEAATNGPVQPAELWPVSNGWQISDHRRFTAVYAGANPERRSTGRLVVFRQNFVHVTQTSDRVDVPNSGPLTITSAPQGKAAQTEAQRDGTLEFKGANGVTGTLHLSDDSVTLHSS
jgi:hypothetical protein